MRMSIVTCVTDVARHHGLRIPWHGITSGAICCTASRRISNDTSGFSVFFFTSFEAGYGCMQGTKLYFLLHSRDAIFWQVTDGRAVDMNRHMRVFLMH